MHAFFISLRKLESFLSLFINDFTKVKRANWYYYMLCITFPNIAVSLYIWINFASCGIIAQMCKINQRGNNNYWLLRVRIYKNVSNAFVCGGGGGGCARMRSVKVRKRYQIWAQCNTEQVSVNLFVSGPPFVCHSEMKSLCPDLLLFFKKAIITRLGAY